MIVFVETNQILPVLETVGGTNCKMKQVDGCLHWWFFKRNPSNCTIAEENHAEADEGEEAERRDVEERW